MKIATTIATVIVATEPTRAFLAFKIDELKANTRAEVLRLSERRFTDEVQKATEFGVPANVIAKVASDYRKRIISMPDAIFTLKDTRERLIRVRKTATEAVKEGAKQHDTVVVKTHPPFEFQDF